VIALRRRKPVREVDTEALRAELRGQGAHGGFDGIGLFSFRLAGVPAPVTNVS